MKKRAVVALKDGAIFEGWSFGAEGEAKGEIVFNTGMTGYQEVLTDPSYQGQMVTMTYPLIGNYGVNLEDNESHRLYPKGFIVREYCPYPSNWHSKVDLDTFLKAHGIVGIQGVDTRALTRHLRDYGAQEGIISTEDFAPESLVKKARAVPSLVGQDMVKEVTCRGPYLWDSTKGGSATPNGKLRVVVYDCGVKYNILRSLSALGGLGLEVLVVPAQTPAEEVLAKEPHGILVSNGPGDPEGVPYMIENVKKLLGKLGSTEGQPRNTAYKTVFRKSGVAPPLFGICLGHQFLALALGLKTYKLKFGHHGSNHPVMDLHTRKVEITTQNHCFAVEGWEGWRDTPYGPVEVTHINLNDRSVEGLRLKDLPVFSVQYHPEASPGPHDARYLFERFLGMVKVRG